MDRVSDSDLITRLQAGSLDALGLLYDRHRKMVFRTALAITGDAEAAGDLLQDVFLRLHRFACHIDTLRPLEPWLYRMTANLAYTWVKRHHRWPRSLEEVAEWLVGSKKNAPPEVTEVDEESPADPAGRFRFTFTPADGGRPLLYKRSLYPGDFRYPGCAGWHGKIPPALWATGPERQPGYAPGQDPY